MKRIALTCKDPGRFFHDCEGCEYYDGCDYFQKVKQTVKQRKLYKKPEIKHVPLRPQESVLGFCKTSNVRGPMIGTCDRPGLCFTEGS